MAETTIQWADYTFNPWIGCRKVAPECANCYAETLDRNRYSKTLDGGTKEKPVSHWGSGPRHRTKTWGDPLKWNRMAPNTFTRRPRVFCASLSDWLDDENVPIEWFADLLRIIHDTPNLDWLLLTKRPQNWQERMDGACVALAMEAYESEEQMAFEWYQHGIPPENVWIGVSAGADQAAALDIPAKVHFLSCEPMLHPMATEHAAKFDWIIFGGESGKNARFCSMQSIRDGVGFCRRNNVAPFVKQLGSNTNYDLKDSHGGDMSEWPEDLRVREFPKA